MRRLIAGTLLSLSLVAGYGTAAAQKGASKEMVKTTLDSLPKEDAKTRYTTLTDADFKRVADRLGVEVAAIKAVVVIEAGEKMEGFWAPGVPVVNFDRSMYNRYGTKAKGKGNPSEKVPSGLKGYALKEWTELVNARKTTVDGANMGTFWGMFQIGGFNYKKCGCETVAEMVKLMSYSELEQLELFATFIINSGMVDDLKKKNWASFARKYNGSSYAKRGYHTRMANAYAKFKKK
ncbi:MAG: N-acetylmuramidase family protein [Muribaculaceae bacterium]|nr:N-acetylmuramidase family protein [Muribaculaceae bacterium]